MFESSFGTVRDRQFNTLTLDKQVVCPGQLCPAHLSVAQGS